MEALEGFWNDSTNAAKIQKEKAVLEDSVKTYTKLKIAIEDFEVMLEMAEMGDESSIQEALVAFPKCQGQMILMHI